MGRSPRCHRVDVGDSVRHRRRGGARGRRRHSRRSKRGGREQVRDGRRRRRRSLPGCGRHQDDRKRAPASQGSPERDDRDLAEAARKGPHSLWRWSLWRRQRGRHGCSRCGKKPVCRERADEAIPHDATGVGLHCRKQRQVERKGTGRELERGAHEADARAANSACRQGRFVGSSEVLHREGLHDEDGLRSELQQARGVSAGLAAPEAPCSCGRGDRALRGHGDAVPDDWPEVLAALGGVDATRSRSGACRVSGSGGRWRGSRAHGERRSVFRGGPCGGPRPAPALALLRRIRLAGRVGGHSAGCSGTATVRHVGAVLASERSCDGCGRRPPRLVARQRPRALGQGPTPEVGQSQRDVPEMDPRLPGGRASVLAVAVIAQQCHANLDHGRVISAEAVTPMPASVPVRARRRRGLAEPRR
mmetsp:Transcript_4327/g.18281  ORF Transcript_4327/g.18281 Transcript_4327/m.18281 type:complete len:419 (-) Transcript_4327:295-1551(-)